jgi:predicted ferric reductase
MSYNAASGQSSRAQSIGSSLLTLALVGAGVMFGAAAGVALLPGWLPALNASIQSLDPKAYWYLSRAAGFGAFGLLWLSMVFGLLITNRMARLWPGGFTAFDLHQYTSLLGLALTAFHGLVLLGDRYINYNLPQLLIPFGSVNYRQAWVGLGQIGFYALVLTTLSFYARRSLGPRGWRIVHGVGYAGFIFALLHGLLSGTDSSAAPVLLFYWFTGVSTLALTIYRILVGQLSRGARSVTA